MSLKASIEAKIKDFDRRSPSLLGEAETQFGKQPGYAAALVGLIAHDEAPVSSGATWLIKSFLEAGGSLSRSQRDSLFNQLGQVTAWDAQLHICQSLQFVKITSRQASLSLDWLRPLLSHRRPFLRAWSLDALCRVGASHPRIGRLAQDWLARGLEDGSASVRARSRQLQKEFGGPAT